MVTIYKCDLCNAEVYFKDDLKRVENKDLCQHCYEVFTELHNEALNEIFKKLHSKEVYQAAQITVILNACKHSFPYFITSNPEFSMYFSLDCCKNKHVFGLYGCPFLKDESCTFRGERKVSEMGQCAMCTR